MTVSVALCPHFSIEHFRGGEKWVVNLANLLANEESIEVLVHALPYAPDGERRVDVNEVLDQRISYEESWRHDLTGVDTAYVFYHPSAKLSFPGANRYIAGIHSWAYISPYLFEDYYGLIPTAVKILHQAVGDYALSRYDVVHSVTPAFESSHSDTIFIPNFVDTNLYRPDRAPLHDDFTVLVSAAHIQEKGWDLAKQVAATLPEEITVVTTGTSETPEIKGLGFLPEAELANLYAQSHVVLHPARVDTDSMVINEACASGTPVVTSPLISHIRKNEAILHGKTPLEMTHLIQHIHNEYNLDKDQYKRRCAVARELAADRSTMTVYPKLKQLLTSGDSSMANSIDHPPQHTEISDETLNMYDARKID